MPEYANAVEILRQALRTLNQSEECTRIVEAQTFVTQRFQETFSRDHLPKLTQDEFRAFLSFEGNCHWTNLTRKQAMIFADLDALRSNLLTLIDERLPIAQRFNQMDTTKGCGKAIITGILLTVFPKKYGVWNGTSEANLRQLNIWPNFPYRFSKGEKYEQINTLLLELAKDLKTDLWTLDALFWKRMVDGAVVGNL